MAVLKNQTQHLSTGNLHITKVKEELVEISHQVVACGQSDEENQLTEQKGDVNVESNAHVVFLMITEKIFTYKDKFITLGSDWRKLDN